MFDGVVPDSTLASLGDGQPHMRRRDHDCVVGLGGGSPLDTAKAMAVLIAHGGVMCDYKAPHIQDAPGLPIIAIPTTAGTGSEATRFVVITDEVSDEKMLCIGSAYVPTAAIVDYTLTLSKPARLTADTGIDAVTHAIEAYVSKKANPVSDGFAVLAMRAIAPNLRRACQDPADHAAREAMMVGAMWAGMAFSASSVALVHGMSRPIGAFFHVPHGLSNAMLLPAVTRFSLSSAKARYAVCAREMGIAAPDSSDDQATVLLLDELIALNHDLQVPTPKSYGIDEARWTSLLVTMADQAIASGSPGNNPRVASPEEIVELYKSSWASPIQPHKKFAASTLFG